ncbi:MAG: TIGR03619 family F420-dependent LLM class oxidoreductase [Myxococcota bacterium]|nr:TIGR03619 family F420-dependent LLM class oxidoreductase [Myxococcota bacterium]
MKFWQVASFAEPDQLLGIARAAEEAGFHGLMVSDHLFIPGRIESRYPYSEDGRPGFDGMTPFPEPWTTIAAMAAVTERLRFGTMVYILPLRHPLPVAKAVGTAAFLSGGRVALGVGAGWIREEFDTLGVDFRTRGRRMDEMIDAMRTVWSGEMVSHRGRFFDFGPLQMTPAPPEPPPVLVGGLSERALRRAATKGDGWIGTGQSPEEAAAILGRLRGLRAEAGREGEPFEAVVPLTVPPDPVLLRDLEAQGMTGATVWPFAYTIGPTSTLDQKRDAMRRFADEVIAKVG